MQISRHAKYCDPTQCRVSAVTMKVGFTAHGPNTQTTIDSSEPVADLLYVEKLQSTASPNLSYAS